MKKIYLTVITFLLEMIINSTFSQDKTESIKYDNFEQTLSGESEVRIWTPFGNHADLNTFTKNSSTWTEAEIEHCKQYWLYEGGVFMTSGSSTFTKKSNYLENHRVLCMDIKNEEIYIGTDAGIYVSTNQGEEWLMQNEDDLADNLIDYQINALSVSSNTFFACTNAGVFVLSNSSGSWTQYYSDRNITSIALGANNDVYISTNTTNKNGVYRSTNGGVTWSETSSIYLSKTLKYGNNTLFAGLKGYDINIKASIDGGANWNDLAFVNKPTASLHIDGTNIYVGTEEYGCWLSTNSGTFFQNISNGLPKISDDPPVYYQINSLSIYNNYLFAATEKGLYKTLLPNCSYWSECCVTESPSNSQPCPKATKMVFVNNDDLWVVCRGDAYYEGIEVIEDLEYPLNPTYFPNYNCTDFAWHLSEGGEALVRLSAPETMKYYNLLETENWDYTEVIGDNAWQNPLWEKVTYDNGTHSGIKKNIENFPPENPEDIRIISKWSPSGPLVDHYLKDTKDAQGNILRRSHPWGNDPDIKFWKCKTKLTGPISEDHKIGRQIVTEGETNIPSGESVEFKVAPMENHGIHLTNGFHAESGSVFHAFVDNSYHKPWEEDVQIARKRDRLNENNKILSANKIQKANMHFMELKISPTPSNPVFLDLISRKIIVEDSVNVFSGKGSGTLEDPYQITNVHQLQEMAVGFLNNNFILMNDIDATETRNWRVGDHDGNPNTPPEPKGFVPITDFENASLDGKGHVIKNLYMNQPASPCISFFGSCEGWKIKNIGLVDCEFSGIAPSGFCTCNSGSSFTIENCFTTGNFVSSKGGSVSEGFCFLFKGIAKNCYSISTVKSDSLTSNFSYMPKDGKAINCYAAGTATGKVNVPFGFKGEATTSFWDNETIIVTDSLGIGTGLPTSAMMKRATFEAAGWDFDSTWYIDEGMDYPRLQVFRHDTTSIVSSRKSFDFNLDCNPNPAENIVNLDFSVSQYCPVSITVSNSLGMKVALVINQKYYSEGSYRQAFDTSALPPGVYFCTLQTPEFTITKQFVVVK